MHCKQWTDRRITELSVCVCVGSCFVWKWTSVNETNANDDPALCKEKRRKKSHNLIQWSFNYFFLYDIVIFEQPMQLLIVRVVVNRCLAHQVWVFALKWSWYCLFNLRSFWRSVFLYRSLARWLAAWMTGARSLRCTVGLMNSRFSAMWITLWIWKLIFKRVNILIVRSTVHPNKCKNWDEEEDENKKNNQNYV